MYPILSSCFPSLLLSYSTSYLSLLPLLVWFSSLPSFCFYCKLQYLIYWVLSHAILLYYWPSQYHYSQTYVSWTFSPNWNSLTWAEEGGMVIEPSHIIILRLPEGELSQVWVILPYVRGSVYPCVVEIASTWSYGACVCGRMPGLGLQVSPIRRSTQS